MPYFSALGNIKASAHILIGVFSLYSTAVRHPIDCPALLVPFALSFLYLRDGQIGSDAASHSIAHHAVPTVHAALITAVQQLRTGHETQINLWSWNVTTKRM